MIKNFISFNNLVARISECRKRMTIVRHEIRLHEESGKEADHEKQELQNLFNEISQLKAKMFDFHNKSRVNQY
jgi:hypothetical protein